VKDKPFDFMMQNLPLRFLLPKQTVAILS